MNKLVLWVVAIPAAIVASLFGFEMYRKVTDKRPMSVRIHEECVKRIGPSLMRLPSIAANLKCSSVTWTRPLIA